jgi:hypothetical protein
VSFFIGMGIAVVMLKEFNENNQESVTVDCQLSPRTACNNLTAFHRK